MISTTRFLSFAPGNSIKILPEFPKRWIFGDETPNPSIRLRNTSKAETIDSSIFVSKILFTSSSVISNLITSLKSRLAKISGEANFVSPLISSKALKKDSK